MLVLMVAMMLVFWIGGAHHGLPGAGQGADHHGKPAARVEAKPAGEAVPAPKADDAPAHRH